MTQTSLRQKRQIFFSCRTWQGKSDNCCDNIMSLAELGSGPTFMRSGRRFVCYNELMLIYFIRRRNSSSQKNGTNGSTDDGLFSDRAVLYDAYCRSPVECRVPVYTALWLTFVSRVPRQMDESLMYWNCRHLFFQVLPLWQRLITSFFIHIWPHTSKKCQVDSVSSPQVH